MQAYLLRREQKSCPEILNMIRQEHDRIDPKRRNTLNYKKKQFATASYNQPSYPFRLNFYDVPPTAEITLEQFEQWAIDRLRSTLQSPVFFIRLTDPTLSQSLLSSKHALFGIRRRPRLRRTCCPSFKSGFPYVQILPHPQTLSMKVSD